MRRKLYYINVILSLFILIILQSCKKENEAEIIKNNIDFSYYPQKVGSWIIYQIQEIKIDAPSNYYDTANYQIKELFESEFIDNTGNTSYRIERYERDNNNTPWKIKDVWTSELSNNSAQKVEENIKFVKINFPAELNKAWNGNIYNTSSYEEYKITDIDKNENINNIIFDFVLTVLQRDEENLIEKYYSVEKYAKNTGLIFKQNIDITSMYILPGEPYYKRIKTGTIYLQKIIDFGLN